MMPQHGFTRVPVTQSHLDWLDQMGFFGMQSGGDQGQMKASFSALELLQYPSGLAIIEEKELTECIYILFEGSAAVTAGEGCLVFRLGKVLLLDLQRKCPGLVPSLLGFAKKHLVHA